MNMLEKRNAEKADWENRQKYQAHWAPGKPESGIPAGALPVGERPIRLIADTQVYFLAGCATQVQAGLKLFVEQADAEMAAAETEYKARMADWTKWSAAGIPVTKPVTPREDWQVTLAREAIQSMVSKTLPDSNEPILIIRRDQANAINWALEQVNIQCATADAA